VAQYWDVQTTLHDNPTVPYDAGQGNPNVSVWGFRGQRNNCEAKPKTRFRGTESVFNSWSPGCHITDYFLCYNGHTYDIAFYRNTNTGPGDVFVNVRVDLTLNNEIC